MQYQSVAVTLKEEQVMNRNRQIAWANVVS